jgi:hypothetical protein
MNRFLEELKFALDLTHPVAVAPPLQGGELVSSSITTIHRF